LDRFVKADLEVVAQIRPSSWSAPAAVRAEQITESEEILKDTATKDIGEFSEDILIELRLTFQSRVPVLIVNGTLFLIRQNAVGFRRFFERFFGLLIAGVFIRMILDGQLAVSTFDLLLAGGPGDSEHLVIISFAGIGQCLSPAHK
jgi:hypothetical protein